MKALLKFLFLPLGKISDLCWQYKRDPQSCSTCWSHAGKLTVPPSFLPCCAMHTSFLCWLSPGPLRPRRTPKSQLPSHPGPSFGLVQVRGNSAICWDSG